MYIALDPYANAFRDDFTIWERKFEIGLALLSNSAGLDVLESNRRQFGLYAFRQNGIQPRAEDHAYRTGPSWRPARPSTLRLPFQVRYAILRENAGGQYRDDLGRLPSIGR